jgi:hypothetical protein
MERIHNLSKPVRTRHWPFSGDCSNIRGQCKENCTKGLYQWLTQRASFFRSDASIRGTSRTVRTEVTVEQQEMTMLVGGAAAGMDICPLCGSKLTPAQAEQVNGRLLKGSISQGTGPGDRSPP